MLGRERIAHSESTIHCQPRSCGRLAPKRAAVGQNVVMAAANRSPTIELPVAVSPAQATAVSARHTVNSETIDQADGATSVVPRTAAYAQRESRQAGDRDQAREKGASRPDRQ